MKVAVLVLVTALLVAEVAPATFRDFMHRHVTQGFPNTNSGWTTFMRGRRLHTKPISTFIRSNTRGVIQAFTNARQYRRGTNLYVSRVPFEAVEVRCARQRCRARARGRKQVVAGIRHRRPVHFQKLL